MQRIADLPEPVQQGFLRLPLPEFESTPWRTPPPLNESRIAIISTAGLHRHEDRTFAGGATSALVGRKTEELIGTPFIDLIADLDKRLMQDLLVVAEKHGRIENQSIRLAGRSGMTAPLSLAGYRLADLGGHYFLALRTAVIQAKSKSGAILGREEQSGLYDSSSFSEIAGDRLQAALGVSECGHAWRRNPVDCQRIYKPIVRQSRLNRSDDESLVVLRITETPAQRDRMHAVATNLADGARCWKRRGTR